jgi:hypothetical protein
LGQSNHLPLGSEKDELFALTTGLSFQIRHVMQNSCMLCGGNKMSVLNEVRESPHQGVCSARHANWPGTVFCLVHNPTDCKYLRYFNNVAYCTNPKREVFVAQTRACGKKH